MDTKNVKNAHYWQVDHRVKKISEKEGVIVLPGSQAWEKFKWSRKWFKQKPKEGYFIWIKKPIDFPLLGCVTVASSGISQNLNNLLVVENNLRVKVNATCNVAKKNLEAIHKAKGKIVLKKGASLEYSHFHQWGEEDMVETDYEFMLEENSKLLYDYKNFSPPKNLNIKNNIFGGAASSSDLSFVVNGRKSNANLEENLFLQGKNSQGQIKLRMVGRDKSKIKAKSTVTAKAPSKGHLDCQGLLLDRNSAISLIPQLNCQHPQSQITHEASIGKIQQEQLNYLRMRGFNRRRSS